MENKNKTPKLNDRDEQKKLKSSPSQLKIKSTKILAVEGQDEWYFFKEMLEKHLKITDVQLIDIGGESNFEKEFATISILPGFSSVKKIGSVRDADTDAKVAFEKICKAIKDGLGLPAPETMNNFTNNKPQIGVFIMPNNSDSGMLEDLCLQSVQKDTVMPCLDAFISCVKNNLPNDKHPKIWSKAKTPVFLATRKDIKSSVGFGAEEGYWIFGHPCFDQLKQFLGNFRDENLIQ